MNNIDWKREAVCYANKSQWIAPLNDGMIEDSLTYTDFQLNEIRTGDYVEASELDTEQKYNDVVDVLGLFGFEPYLNYDLNKSSFCKTGSDKETGLVVVQRNVELDYDNVDYRGVRKRKLTYSQIMAIGKLKRMIDEKSAVKSAPKTATEVSVNKKHKPIVAQVMIDLTERMEVGIKEYGEALRPHNGRDALQDAYEEALDLACYLKQAIIERDSK